MLWLIIIYVQVFLLILISFFKFFCGSDNEILLNYFFYLIDIVEKIFIDTKVSIVDESSVMRVSIYATVSDDLPWIITVFNNHVFTNMYEPVLKVLYLKNNSALVTTAIAIVDIIPSELRGLLHKQQCFCYEPIRLYPWGVVYLPIVIEVVDHLIDVLPNFRSVVIYYTFFRISW